MHRRSTVSPAVLVPLATLLFAARGDLWQTNMSGIGAEQGIRPLLALWGAGAALYVFFRAGALLRAADIAPAPGGYLLFAGCFLLMLGTAIPYGGDTPPLPSAMHVAFSMGGSLLGAAALGIFTGALSASHPAVFRQAMPLYVLLALGAAWLFLAGDVTGLLEVYAALAVCLYTEKLHTWLQCERAQARVIGVCACHFPEGNATFSSIPPGTGVRHR